jgi:hypothetical protein
MIDQAAQLVAEFFPSRPEAGVADRNNDVASFDAPKSVYRIIAACSACVA